MFWRVLIGLGGLTFLVGGFDVLGSGCEDVDFGGSRRAATYTCVPAGEGDVSAALGGWGMVALAALMLLYAFWPLVRALHIGASRAVGVEPAVVRSDYSTELSDLSGLARRFVDSVDQVAVWDSRREDIYAAATEFARRHNLADETRFWKLHRSFVFADGPIPLVVVMPHALWLCSRSGEVPIRKNSDPSVTVERDRWRRDLVAIVINDHRLLHPRPTSAVKALLERYPGYETIQATQVETEVSPDADAGRTEAAESATPKEGEDEVDSNHVAANAATPSPTTISIEKSLRALEELRDRAAISEQEYEQMRSDILSRI